GKKISEFGVTQNVLTTLAVAINKNRATNKINKVLKWRSHSSKRRNVAYSMLSPDFRLHRLF
ncbi:hypothetical protein, partial [Kamptonema sp. PCC 6506]|uniref:hypothetical protein n=1 Tax=Kamptonema sp. PCC 6506 TaxID=272129 RepID=UPI001F3B8608